MREQHHRAVVRVCLSGAIGLGIVAMAGPPVVLAAERAESGAAVAPTVDVGDLSACPSPRAGRPSVAATPRWSATLDAAGELYGYELELVGPQGPVVVAAGARAFVSELVAGRVILGERDETATRLVVLDAASACRLRTVTLPGLAYDLRLEDSGRTVTYVRVDPARRQGPARFRSDLDSPALAEPLGDDCALPCAPSDEAVEPAVVPTYVDPRPVPTYQGTRWPANTALTFRWQPGEAPPDWAREAIRAAADDASGSRGSKAPTFEYSSSATDTVRYSAVFPDNCRYGIACASRSVPTWWTIRLRAHGTDFAWGVLRWCQRTDADGCFDIERTALHEFGHVAGLDHPDDHGFRLAARKTVMHAVIPARPQTGSGQHGYGACDVAALQLVFDVPGSGTAISDCLALATRLTIAASKTRVNSGDTVRITADLEIADRDGYGPLGGDALRDRSVVVRYRRAGGGEPWTNAWMKDGAANGTYVVTLAPLASWEIQAVFRTPDDEGLVGTTSDSVVVRVAGDCAAACPAGGAH